MDKLLRAALAAMQGNAVYGRVRAESWHVLIVAVAGGIAAVFVILALLWFDLALWFYCAPRLGPAVAALIAGGAFLPVALIAVVVILLTRAGPPRPAASPDTTLLAANAIKELDGFVREHKGLALAVAALAGAVLGANPPPRP